MYRLWFTVWFHAPPRFLDFPPFLGFTPGGPLGLCGSGKSGIGAGVFGVVILDPESLGGESLGGGSLGGVLGGTFELGGGLEL